MYKKKVVGITLALLFASAFLSIQIKFNSSTSDSYSSVYQPSGTSIDLFDIASIEVTGIKEAAAREETCVPALGHVCGETYPRWCPNLQMWITNCDATNQWLVCFEDEGYCGGA